MKPLYERARPDTLDNVAGQDRAVTVIRRLHQRGELAGNAYWLSGPSGTGKTTLARIIARLAVGGEFEESDAGPLLPTTVRDWERSWALRPLFGDGYALIINEAHGLRKDTVRQLLTTMERLPSYVTLIFTTTSQGQERLFDDCIDAGPLLSRCVPLPLTHRGEDVCLALALRVRQVAQSEGLDGQPIDRYVKLVRDNGFNMRACLQAVAAGQLLDA